MGFSFSAIAGDKLRLIEDICYKLTGSTNTFITKNGKKCFFEIDRIDHSDCSITGEVLDFNTCKVIKKFKILSNGKIINFSDLNHLIK